MLIKGLILCSPGTERNQDNETIASPQHCSYTWGIFTIIELCNFEDQIRSCSHQRFLNLNFQVIGSKTKIYIVMEYVSGGQLSDKMVRFNNRGKLMILSKTIFWEKFISQSYIRRLSESEARKNFQQLIDAVDYCHCRGVYHRDLKVRMKNILLILIDNHPKGILQIWTKIWHSICSHRICFWIAREI